MPDLCNQILDSAGISKDHPEWGLQYCLAHAAVDTQLVRHGSFDSVRCVLEQHAFIKRTHDTELDKYLWLEGNPHA